jgi:hypothetical protein
VNLNFGCTKIPKSGPLMGPICTQCHVSLLKISPCETWLRKLLIIRLFFIDWLRGGVVVGPLSVKGHVGLGGDNSL